MRHTRYGYWLEEAGPVEPTGPLEGDTTADVVVVGGGYLGLWTAWQLKALEPALDVVVLDAGLAGHGPSGRNGGFVSTLWDDLPILRDRVGDAKRGRGLPRLGAGRARDRRLLRGAGRRRAGTAPAARSRSRRARRSWATGTSSSKPAGGRRTRGSTAALARRDRGTMRLAGVPRRHGAADGGQRPARATRARPPRAGDRGRRPAARAHRCPQARGGRQREHAPAARSAPGQRCSRSTAPPAGFSGFRHALAVASSHMVITEPVPDVIEEIGWTGGENIHDCRTLLHYFRTTKDGRIALGWGGGRMGVGGRHRDRLDIDRSGRQARSCRAAPLLPRACRTRRSRMPGVARSTSHPPICRSSGRAATCTTASGSPATASGRPTSAARSWPASHSTGGTRRRALAIVEPDRSLFPPEPLRFVGGTTIRAALVRRDEAIDRGDESRRADRLRRLAAAPARASTTALGPSAQASAGSTSVARTSSSGTSGSASSGGRVAASVSAEPLVDGCERLEEVRRQARLLLRCRDLLHLGDVPSGLGGDALQDARGALDELRIVAAQVCEDDLEDAVGSGRPQRLRQQRGLPLVERCRRHLDRRGGSDRLAHDDELEPRSDEPGDLSCAERRPGRRSWSRRPAAARPRSNRRRHRAPHRQGSRQPSPSSSGQSRSDPQRAGLRRCVRQRRRCPAPPAPRRREERSRGRSRDAPTTASRLGSCSIPSASRSVLALRPSSVATTLAPPAASARPTAEPIAPGLTMPTVTTQQAFRRERT